MFFSLVASFLQTDKGLCQLHIGGAHIPQLPAGLYGVPALPFSVNGDGRPLGQAADNAGVGKGALAQVQVSPCGGDCSDLGRNGLGKGEKEVFRHGLRHIDGDGLDIFPDPAGVLLVVVVGELDEGGGRDGFGDLSQPEGGNGPHPFGVGINLPEVGRDDLGGPAAVPAPGGVVDLGAPERPLLPLGGGVGMEGEVEVVGAFLGLLDGGSGGHVRGVAGVADAVGQQPGDQGVRDEVHVVFLVPAAVIEVVFLGGGAEIDAGHRHHPFQSFSLFYEKCKKEVTKPRFWIIIGGEGKEFLP